MPRYKVDYTETTNSGLRKFTAIVKAPNKSAAIDKVKAANAGGSTAIHKVKSQSA